MSDLDIDDIQYLPLAKQAELVDQVCVAGVNDPEFVKDGLTELFNKNAYPQWNSTSIGNCAFLAIHAPDETSRNEYKRGINEYFAWYKSRKRTCGIS